MHHKADFILKSNCIYTVASETPISGGIAVIGDRILAVGTAEELRPYVGANTEIRDYTGKMLLPGFIEAHNHAHSVVPTVDLLGAMSIEECIQRIKLFIAEHPDEEIINGFGWSAANWGGTPPCKEDLDAVFPYQPIILCDMDGHQGWVNSALMEKTGISKETAPELIKKHTGSVDYNEKGELSGVLHDAILLYARSYLPERAEEEFIAPCIDAWTKYGVTTVNECGFYKSNSTALHTLKIMEDGGRLNVRIFPSYDARIATDEDIQQGTALYHTDMFHMNALKCAIDGVAPGYTALMLRPYADKPDCYGDCSFTKERLVEFVRMAARNGLAVHIHCCGDGSVRLALDAYEAAAKEGIQLDTRFSIEHCDAMDGADVPRFAQLGVSANMTPDFMPGSPVFNRSPYFAVLDKETQEGLWRAKSVLDAGGNLAFGTDGGASSQNTMIQLFRAVERVADDWEPKGGYHPAEKLTIQEAIRCYTLNSAKAVGMVDKIGTLEAGKYADIIALDRNILSCTPRELKETRVVMTMVGGRTVLDT